LIQAPMAGAQDERLALAVSAAGGLGSLPAAMLDADTLHTKLQVLQGSGLPYNVNFFCHKQEPLTPVASQTWQTVLAPYYAQYGLNPNTPGAPASRRPFDAHMAEVLEAFRPTVVSFHFGLPEKDLLAAVKARGAFVLSSATTVREALWLQANGADGIIVQGLEAGGHRGHFLDKDVGLQSPSLDLLVAVAKQISLPLIAAGGIAQATDVAEAMALGASGVQAGTAFLLCDEALTSPLHRARLRDVTAPTELTNVFTGGLARGMVNRAMQELGPVSAYAPPFPHASDAMLPLRTQAESLAQDAFTPLWSGTNRSGCLEGPASHVMIALSRGFE
jgi:nitronate monooxygenase